MRILICCCMASLVFFHFTANGLSKQHKEKTELEYKTAEQQVKLFEQPKVKGYRLAYCSKPARHCGRFVANSWCRSQGYKEAKTYSVADNIGAQRPTYYIGAKLVCHHPSCDGFETITCIK